MIVIIQISKELVMVIIFRVHKPIKRVSLPPRHRRSRVGQHLSLAFPSPSEHLRPET